MTRRLISALLAAALLPLATTPAVAGAPDRSERAQRAAQVKIVAKSSPFSPNGDGHRDRTTVRYRLTDDARVSVEVTYRGKTVLRTAPKTARPGTRSFRWDGTRTSGKRAADGRYRVVVHATGRGATRTDSTSVVLRTRPTRVNGGTLQLSSDTVYPYAKLINDVVVGNFSLRYPTVVGDTELRQTLSRVVEASRAQVLDKSGRVIAVEPIAAVASRAMQMDAPVNCGPCGRFTWDGRDADGVRQAPGTYRIRVVQGRDSAGNTRILTPTRTVTISRKQLETKTRLVGLVARDVPRTEVPFTGCQGCGEGICAPSSSARFTGGLTFDTTVPGCTTTIAYFTVPVIGRRTPYDRFSVTATGGPSTVGGDASAVLVTGLSSQPTFPLTGDTTTSSYADLMTANSEVYPADWPQAVIWTVSGATGSYDVASFNVAISTYVPAG